LIRCNLLSSLYLISLLALLDSYQDTLNYEGFLFRFPFWAGNYLLCYNDAAIGSCLKIILSADLNVNFHHYLLSVLAHYCGSCITEIFLSEVKAQKLQQHTIYNTDVARSRSTDMAAQITVSVKLGAGHCATRHVSLSALSSPTSAAASSFGVACLTQSCASTTVASSSSGVAWATCTIHHGSKIH
jgi:hypothetical protein